MGRQKWAKIGKKGRDHISKSCEYPDGLYPKGDGRKAGCIVVVFFSITVELQYQFQVYHITVRQLYNLGSYPFGKASTHLALYSYHNIIYYSIYLMALSVAPITATLPLCPNQDSYPSKFKGELLCGDLFQYFKRVYLPKVGKLFL